jgi:hypothetical protein
VEKKVSKKETIEEFLARGGKITVIPPNEKSESTHVIPIKTQLDYDMMSLGEGEFLFGETRSKKVKKMKKRVSTDDFNKMVESMNLPQDIVDALRRPVK